MLTASPYKPDSAVLLTIGQIAERDRVSKQTVSAHVKRLAERHPLYVERDGRGRVAVVNAAQYDQLRSRLADPSKAQAPAPPPQTPQAGDSYDEALRLKTHYEAERKRLELDQLKGKLVPVEQIADALDRAADIAKEALASIEDAADDISAASARDGVRGVRAALKRLRLEAATRQMEAFAAEARLLRSAIHNDVQEGSDLRQ